MEAKRVKCIACGTIHYDTICPNCKCAIWAYMTDN